MAAGNPRALVGAGDAERRRVLCADLRAQGMQVMEVADGLDALSHLRSTGVDVALVAVDLPGIDGLELVRRIRRESTVPIILIASASDAGASIIGLEAGADDYLIWPCVPSEVGARVRAVIRRARAFVEEPTILRSGLVDLDLERRRCFREGQEVVLTRREFDLLSALLRYEGRIHTRSQLLALVWGGDGVTPKTVDVHVASLRRKLGPSIRITTLRGVGYRIDPAESLAQPAPDVQ